MPARIGRDGMEGAPELREALRRDLQDEDGMVDLVLDRYGDPVSRRADENQAE